MQKLIMNLMTGGFYLFKLMVFSTVFTGLVSAHCVGLSSYNIY